MDGKSVTNIYPGLCVMANGTLESIRILCGVTPQAWNTGTSSLAISIDSPHSGSWMFSIPIADADPTATGPPCA